MLNIPASLTPVQALPDPLQIATDSRNLRALGQQNQQRQIALPFEAQRMQQEQDLRGQQIQGFQPQLDATKLKNEEMANELAETFISNKAKELKTLPLEQRAEAGKQITDWLTKRQEMYPEYTHIYDPSHFANATWDDKQLSDLEHISLSPDERAKLENPKGPDVGSFEDFVTRKYGATPTSEQVFGAHKEWEGAKKVPTTSVNVSTGQSLGKEVAKNFADEVSKAGDDARSAIATLPSIQNSIELVDQGIIAGTGADIRLSMAKALATATGTPDEEVNNTDQFVANTANLVAQNIKNFGSGTGLSDADREYAQKMAGGSTKMTPQAIKRILQINQKMQIGKIDRYNERRKTLVDNNPELAGYYPELKAPTMPKSTPKGPKKGDVEDGYRFKGGDPAKTSNWEKVK